MKKIILIILICSFILLGLTGCIINKNKFNIGQESNIDIEVTDVSLSIKENTLTKTGTTLIIKNNSNGEVIYDEPYELEVKKEGKWHKINVEISFNEPAYILKSQESNEITINWKNEYGTLSSGDYRVIKSYSIEENEISKTYYISSEFTIE